MQITKHNYRQYPAYNYSFLTDVKRMLQGLPLTTETPSMSFGTIMHKVILEHEPITSFDLSPTQHRKAEGMLDAAREDTFFRSWILDDTEVPILWRDRVTRLRCKGLIDKKRDDEAFDFKTTGVTTEIEFRQAIRKYDYERQAAFYMDGAKVKTFHIVAISTKAPHTIFRYTYTKRKRSMDAARRRYRFLLNKCKELGIKPNHDLVTFEQQRRVAV